MGEMVEVEPELPTTLAPYPVGWYSVGFSEEFPRGAVVTRRLGGKEVLVARTASGAVTAMDPICPHLGAHMGHGGTVEGETVRCPFHGFRFGVDGACVATGYDTKAPRVSVNTWPIQENHGVVLVYLDPRGQPPVFEIPRLEDEDFTKLRTKSYNLRGHPQDTTENSVDFGHLSVVHGYSNVKMHGELQLDGSVLRARYSMHHPFGLARGSGGIDAQFDVTVRGLGYSMVEVLIPKLGMQTRSFVFASPRGPMDLELRIAMSVKKIQRSKMPAFVKKLAAPRLVEKLAEELLLRQAFAAYANDVEQDFVIWKNKQYVARPALALGDGPIMKYRRWAEQFYPERAASRGRLAVIE
jgi:nitrite reductase/ring-hydroxylating ferredoxin subunit